MGIDIASLTEHLDRIERIPDQRWMETLDDRKRKLMSWIFTFEFWKPKTTK